MCVCAWRTYACSWDEMAKYDLPAMLGYVLQQTGAPKIQYMGHSMGTMTAFALFSLNTPLAGRVCVCARARVHATD